MRRRVLTTLLASLALLFLLLPAAQADQVQLYFTGTTSGGDLDPYKMIISPVGTQPPTDGYIAWLNCDDHHDYIQGGESWIADVIPGSAADLSITEMSRENGWGEAYADEMYDAKGWIELHYSEVNNPDFSNAIWAIFDPTWGATNCTGTCSTLLNNAIDAAAADSANDYPTYRQTLTIYSWKPGNPVNDQYDGYPPQEFDQVPDGGLTLMLLGGVLVGLEALRRKFRG